MPRTSWPAMAALPVLPLLARPGEDAATTPKNPAAAAADWHPSGGASTSIGAAGHLRRRRCPLLVIR